MRLTINCFLDPTGVSWTAHIMFLLWNQVDSKFQNKSGHKDFGWGIVDSNHSIIVYKSRHLIFFACCCCFVTQSCPTPCDLMGCSMPGFLVLHYLLEFAQTHVHWVGDAIQPPHPLSSPSSLALNLSQPQGLFQWVNSSQSIGASTSASVLQWMFKVDFP